MNYGELKTEWQTRLGITDNNDVVLPGLINEGLRTISNRGQFDFYKADATIPLTAARTTGTVAVTNGSTSVTFSSAPGDGVIGQVIQIEDDAEWYLIDSLATTVATLRGAYVGTTDAAASYTVWYWQVTLPSDYSAASLKQVKLQDPDRELPSVYEDDWMRRIGNLTYSRGTPEVVFEQGERLLQLHPLPESAGNLYVKYYRRPDEFVHDGDDTEIDLPEQYHDVLLHFCLFSHAGGIRDTMINIWLQQFEADMKTMQRRHSLKHSNRVRGRRWTPRVRSGRVLNGELD